MEWMLFVIVISIILGALRGGQLRNLTEIHVKLWWMLPVGFVMLAIANFLPPEYHDAAVALILGSYLPLLLFVWLNRDSSGIWIAGIGILMNFTVIVANAGMPVLAEAAVIAGGGDGQLVLGAKHVLLTTETVLPFLADVIPVPRSVLSLGDVFLAIGIGVFLEDQMRKPLSLFSHRVTGVPGSAVDTER